MTLTIRAITDADWPAVWPILHATFAAGETYTYPRDSSEQDIRRTWTEVPRATYVACNENQEILGTYFLKPNQTGGGSHVCNCGYVVAAATQGKGVAAAMCEHSQVEAVRLGFRAMQFNFVVSTNERAVALWQRLGFAIVGRLPGAFLHPTLGYVDAFVMFKTLA